MNSLSLLKGKATPRNTEPYRHHSTVTIAMRVNSITVDICNNRDGRLITYSKQREGRKHTNGHGDVLL
jgi:hypothetical protein